MPCATTNDLIEFCGRVIHGTHDKNASLDHHAAAIRRSLEQLIQSDDYLRAIRSEELDGSEPNLGGLLENNTDCFDGREPGDVAQRTQVTAAITVHLVDGSSMTHEQMLRWIAGCLNCNTNHAVVTVEAQ